MASHEETGAAIAASGQQSALREFWREQAPLVLGLLLLGYLSAYWQHGFLPGAERAFPLADATVPLWHLVWMGFWTGYTLALVGEASGIFALPYSMSVLQFTSVHVTPTTQFLTLLNPLGALFGFRRNRQSNRDFAFWVCLGGVAGALIGPFLRISVLADPARFRAAVGAALVIVGIYLVRSALVRLFGLGRANAIEQKIDREFSRTRGQGVAPSGVPPGTGIHTVSKAGATLTIEFWGEHWRLPKAALVGTGILVGIAASALGVGGGFLLVPAFVAFFRLPMYVLVAAAIPFVMCLSAVSIVTYLAIVPAVFGTEAVQPEWAWSFFAAAGGVFGAWLASKTQRFVPESLLKVMLGVVTCVGGTLYVVDFFIGLPFDF